jgi:pyruvate/2-oxoglutarate dehydrogenase complex dihydrolipoamide acyltransferase (E2) component
LDTREVLVPQMGEGLQEVRIISFAKKPGDAVGPDEIIYTMETDKALMPMESPYAGTLTEWLANEGDVLPIGAPIARIAERSGDGAAAVAAETQPSALAQPKRSQNDVGPSHDPGRLPGRISPLAAVSGGELLIPPRTRAYCRDLGISEEEMRSIHAPSGKLMPADVDTYLPNRAAATAVRSSPKKTRASSAKFVDRVISPAQRTFVMRIKRSQELVVPVVIKRSIDWSTITRVAEARKLFGDVQPSTFQTFAYAVAGSVKEHPKLRSTMPTDDKVREYEHLNLGIAVGLPKGQLNVAVVPEADSLDFDGFVRTAQRNIAEARAGRDQANESVQMLLTYMGGYEIEDAIPLLVAPAVAILFIGSSCQTADGLRANLTMTFDHRLIQGMEAAEFLKTVAQRSSDIETWRAT